MCFERYFIVETIKKAGKDIYVSEKDITEKHVFSCSRQNFLERGWHKAPAIPKNLAFLSVFAITCKVYRCGSRSKSARGNPAALSFRPGRNIEDAIKTVIQAFWCVRRASGLHGSMTVQNWTAGAPGSEKSREVAEMVGKDHNELMKDIRRYISQLAEGKIPHSDFFTESNYTDANNRQRPCYLVTKKGCEFIAHKLTGIKRYMQDLAESKIGLSELSLLRGRIGTAENSAVKISTPYRSKKKIENRERICYTGRTESQSA